MILNRFVEDFSKRDCGSLGIARLPHKVTGSIPKAETDTNIYFSVDGLYSLSIKPF